MRGDVSIHERDLVQVTTSVSSKFSWTRERLGFGLSSSSAFSPLSTNATSFQLCCCRLVYLKKIKKFKKKSQSKRLLSLLVLNLIASKKPTFSRTLRTTVWSHFETCGEKSAVCQLGKKSFAYHRDRRIFIAHNAIASNNENEVANQKALSILYERYCKECT